MSLPTLAPGVLRVASAVPDPPFEFERDGGLAGFDVDLMKAISADLGLSWQPCRYTGADFNGIFDGLADGSWDCVASGTTITPDRERKADFCAPYLASGQSLVCNVRRTPHVRSVDDLAGLVIGVQRGNTSEPVAEQLKAAGKAADVRVYPYHGVAEMLNDLEAGTIGAVMKLAPVMHWLTRQRPALRIVQTGITEEKLAICVRRGADALRAAIDASQARLASSGALGGLVAEWTTL
ncbi:ABC transporter substrate-binding protein [Roseiarcus sp.]|uniref:ABC transporter substrate-binding protein n=1 Tax=Roseiarcus sp. TaxID=1969460 RepID=UPI003F9C0E2E